MHNDRLHINFIYYYTKEKIVCTVKYAGNCQSVKSNKNAEKHRKNKRKTCFLGWDMVRYLSEWKKVFFLCLKRAASQAAR